MMEPQRTAIFQTPAKPTAIFCGRDLIAPGRALKAL